MPRSSGAITALLVILIGPPAWAGPADASADIATRVQVIFDPVSSQVSRRLVRVVALGVEPGLDFTWEPAAGNAPGIDSDGFATGSGTLIWRIPGTAAYDPRSVATRAEGEFVRGALEGHGRLSLRDGSWRDGLWHAGLQEGAGRWRHPDGALYEGEFRAGVPEGTGVLRSAAGWIYSGAFQNGLPEGQGRMRLPTGEDYPVTMRAGAPTPAAGSEALLPVQAQGDAARVQITVASNARIALQQSVSYTHYNDGQALQIYPQDDSGNSDDFLAVWNGGGAMRLPFQFAEMTHEDWLATRAFLDITLQTVDGGKVRLDRLDLVDDRSTPYLKPMLDVEYETGCIGSRPWFEFVNAGWGPVEAPTLQVSFASPESYDLDADSYQPVTGTYAVEIAPFDTGLTVDLRPTLRAAGVDLDTLEGSRFSCPSEAMLDTCSANLIGSVPFGELARAVAVEGAALRTAVVGRLDYQWRDGFGEVHQVSETFSRAITLARIELPGMAAEMGSGGAFATPAPEFREIELPVEGSDLTVNLPLRGNPNLARADAHVQLFAERSSVHQMRVEARLGDGSVASSMPLQLFYLSPRDTGSWQSTIRPGRCFLGVEY